MTQDFELCDSGRIQKHVENLEGFDGHEVFPILHGHTKKPLVVVFVHRKGPGLPVPNGAIIRSLGGTRLWSYRSDDDAFRDGLRLSYHMSLKAWAAGLSLGGAKAVIFKHNLDGMPLEHLWPHYGQLLNNIGYYQTAEDVGMKPHMLKELSKYTRKGLVSGANEAQNPAPTTARGVLLALDTASSRVFSDDCMRRLTFAVKGVGDVGSRIVRTLIEDKKVRKVYIADTNDRWVGNPVANLKRKFPAQIYVSTPEQIMFEDVDVFMPCALGGDITEDAVPNLRAKLVLGCANNQLATRAAGMLLHKYGIWYAPDFMVNAGGLIRVVEDVIYERDDEEELQKRLNVIRQNISTVFDHAKESCDAPSRVAVEFAKDCGKEICSTA